MEGSSSDSGQKSKQNSGKTKFQLLLISGLKKEIEAARRLDPEKLAAEIEKIGFSCQQCGKCCKRAFGDNRVLVIPREIEIIREYSGLPKLEIAGPLIPDVFESGPGVDKVKGAHEDGVHGDKEAEKSTVSEKFEGISLDTGDALQLPELLEEDIDSEGNIHAFGWMLRRKRNGDCSFLEKGTNRCRIYPVRPMLCRTYPFYMEELKLYTCECEGLGYPISGGESLKLAEDLLSRYLAELEDMLAVYEKFENFEKDGGGLKLARENMEKGAFAFIVHDSSGVSKISVKVQESD
ncbi:TPA: YkgJ family cysteine cluster protein [Methanosarcinaceae archaeon]|nr:YkgJ family cysteine cluster protein [Methanosarcinaceae archaeon]